MHKANGIVRLAMPLESTSQLVASVMKKPPLTSSINGQTLSRAHKGNVKKAEIGT